MKRYFRIMLGQKSIYADECYKGNFIGVDFLPDIDLNGQLPDIWRDFNQKFIPIYLEKKPEKSKVAAGLACGALWTVSKGIAIGNIVLCPSGSGSYYVGEILDGYSFHVGGNLPHRRNVKWYAKTIDRTSMSEALKNSAGSIGTVSEISKHAEEIENLIAGIKIPPLIATDETVDL